MIQKNYSRTNRVAKLLKLKKLLCKPHHLRFMKKFHQLMQIRKLWTNKLKIYRLEYIFKKIYLFLKSSLKFKLL